MTNIQLLLSIGIPSMLVVLAWLSNNSRLNRVEQRLDRVDQRFDRVDQRFESVIDASHRDALEIMRSMTAVHERVAVVEAKQNG